jgi:hypothetical protein
MLSEENIPEKNKRVKKMKYKEKLNVLISKAGLTK